MNTRINTCIFTHNYLQELPDDIKILIYNRVYKDNFTFVLKEFQAYLTNLKHFNNLKHYLVYQDEPKINLLHFLSQNIYTGDAKANARGANTSLLSLYKKHLMIAGFKRVRTIKIPANLYKHLDKIIANTFIKFMNKSKYNGDLSSKIYIDDTGYYYVLEYDRYFLCFADLYLTLLTFWKFIRIKLYEFYDIHRDAYNLYITNLLKSDYDTGLYIWLGGNITDDILATNLVKLKNEDPSIYRKIIRQRRTISKSENLYLNFEVRNNIDSYSIVNEAIIMRLKEI
uniref:Uncharacterized protein n=1 Tax=viral metagenome TaxID=1070528 RepID=A0A6C0K632_9ZZZZ